MVAAKAAGFCWEIGAVSEIPGWYPRYRAGIRDTALVSERPRRYLAPLHWLGAPAEYHERLGRLVVTEVTGTLGQNGARAFNSLKGVAG